MIEKMVAQFFCVVLAGGLGCWFVNHNLDRPENVLAALGLVVLSVIVTAQYYKITLWVTAKNIMHPYRGGRK